MAKQSAVTSAEMNANWQDFLHSKVNSFIKWDLVRFFHDNPHTVDTAENIARYMGRDATTIEQELEGLVEADVLITEVMSGVTTYRLTTDEVIRGLVREFMAACYDREFRVKAIAEVIQGMGFSPRREF